MRVGTNPLANGKVPALPPVVICVICHLPELSGYHADRLEVVATSLTAARKNAGMDAKFLVWDNGSCKQLRKWYRKFDPDYLMETPNIGKTTARFMIGRMFPEMTVLAIADDDIFYYPDWLKKQYALMNHFPGVSLVSGYPVRTSFRWGNENTVRWAKKNAHIVTGRFIPDQWEIDFCHSIGRDYLYHAEKTKDEMDMKVKYRFVEAFVTGHHCQFITLAKFLAKMRPFEGMAMADEKPLDVMMDQLGLRLCTTERLTRHIGNVMTFTREEAEEMGVYSNGK